MTDGVKKFIEENINLIERNNFDELFRRANLDLADRLEVGELSKILEDAGIYLLDYTDTIPMNYMYGADIVMLAPKPGIKRIGEEAYKYCDELVSVDLPEGLEYIDEWAFESCPNLRELRLPKSIKHIANSAFNSSLDHPDLVAYAPYPSYANEWLNNHIYS